MAADYDEVRPEVKESQERSLEDLQSANAPDARSVVTELDEADALDEIRRGSGVLAPTSTPVVQTPIMEISSTKAGERPAPRPSNVGSV